MWVPVTVTAAITGGPSHLRAPSVSGRGRHRHGREGEHAPLLVDGPQGALRHTHNTRTPRARPVWCVTRRVAGGRRVLLLRLLPASGKLAGQDAPAHCPCVVPNLRGAQMDRRRGAPTDRRGSRAEAAPLYSAQTQTTCGDDTGRVPVRDAGVAAQACPRGHQRTHCLSLGCGKRKRWVWRRAWRRREEAQRRHSGGTAEGRPHRWAHPRTGSKHARRQPSGVAAPAHTAARLSERLRASARRPRSPLPVPRRFQTQIRPAHRRGQPDPGARGPCPLSADTWHARGARVT